MRVTKYLLLGTVMGTAAVLSFPSNAQEPSRGQTVLERPRPDFDPKGLPVGGIRIFPQITVQESYDDNIRADNDNTESDFVTTISPRVDIRGIGARGLSIGASGYGEVSRYLENSSENAESYGAAVRADYDWTQAQKIAASLSYDHLTEDRTDAEDEGREERSEFDVFGGQAKYTHRFSRLNLGMTGSVRRVAFKDAVDEDRDRTIYRLAPRATYDVSPGLGAFIQPHYQFRDYDEKESGSNRDRDSQNYGASVGTVFDISTLLVGEVGVGVAHYTYADDAFESFTGLTADGSLTWNPTGLTSVVGRVSRDDVATNQVNASSKVRSAASVVVQHELLRNVLLDAGVSYFNEDFKGTDREDDNLRLSLGGQYLLNRNLSLVVDYSYGQRFSNLDQEEYKKNVITVGIRGRL